MEIVKRDPEEQVSVECECGQVVAGKLKDIQVEMVKHRDGHPPLTMGQWKEAYDKIEEGRERAKKSAPGARDH